MHTLSRMESQTWYVTRLFRQYSVLILFIDTAPFGTRDWLNASLRTMEDYEHRSRQSHPMDQADRAIFTFASRQL